VTDTGFWEPLFDDNCWDEVIVPHDWAVSFSFSEKWSSGTGYLCGGTGWYRAVFQAPEHWGGAFVCFDGIYKNSEVWCNGHYLGKRPNGYIGFRHDVSRCLQKGDNTIAVKVSHEDFADSRWYTGSGIYRKASVRFYETMYVDDHTMAVRTAYHGNEADIVISGEINGNASEKPVELIACLAEYYASNSPNSGSPVPLSANQKIQGKVFELSVKVPNPRLWSPETPKLYELYLELREEEVLSRTKPVRIGIRTIQFDPDRGFFLNGNPYKIKGICVHHDAGCLGAAVWPDVWRRRLEKLKGMGCNAIRTSHNPHMDELYDLCDEMCFLVMDEAFDEWEGCKNKWTRGHNVYPPVHQGYAGDYPQWHRKDLEDMVIRDRNHPSVIVWSIGNEIDYPNDPYVHPLFTEMTGNNDANKPKQEMMYNPGKPNMERLAVIAAELSGIVKKTDPTRPVLFAAAFPELSSQLGIFDALDIVGYNYKEHLYEADHLRFPRLPILGSETGHSVQAWKTVQNNEYISAQFLWTGIDYLGEARSWPIHGSGAGLLDCAGNEKTAYFRRKALWSGKPFMYLASRPCAKEKDPKDPNEETPPWNLFRSWDYAPGQLVQVVCYTNLSQAELFCNGKSCGTGTPHENYGYVSWLVPFERGILRAAGSSVNAEAYDAVESTLPPVSLQLCEWSPESPPPGNPAGKYRIAQIEARMLDEAGRLCTGACQTVTVSLKGEGTVLGMENGDLADCTEYALRRRLYRGRLTIYALLNVSAEKKEPAVLTASVDGFCPATISLEGRWIP
jgi:hypothetical protein